MYDGNPTSNEPGSVSITGTGPAAEERRGGGVREKRHAAGREVLNRHRARAARRISPASANQVVERMKSVVAQSRQGQR